MKKKVPRRRIDVNVEELDRIIDGAKSVPLSESDSEKLKTALHALAERQIRIDARGKLAHNARAQKKFVRNDFGISRVFAKCRNKIS